MLQAIARSPTVYDTNRPEPTSTTRNRRNAPKPPTWRNRGGQPKAWKPTELREAISDFKLVQENRTRASQAKELEGTLQAQGVPRTEWPAMIEAAGFSPLPPRPRPQPTAAAAARTDGPRPGAGRRIYLPGAYGDFAEAAGFGASDPAEHLDADEGDVKVKHVLQGLWKVEAGGWVVEGECPVSGRRFCGDVEGEEPADDGQDLPERLAGRIRLSWSWSGQRHPDARPLEN